MAIDIQHTYASNDYLSSVKIGNNRIYHIVAASAGLGSIGNNGVWVNGVLISQSSRSHFINVINNSGQIIFQRNYDVYGGGACCGGYSESHFRADIDTYNVNNNLIIINTWDEPASNSGVINAKLRDDPFNFKTIMLNTVFRDAWCGIYRHGYGVLAESVSASWKANGAGVDVYGNEGRAFCTCQATVVMN
jgi:hypothetical protein